MIATKDGRAVEFTFTGETVVVDWNCASAGGPNWPDYDGLELAYCEHYDAETGEPVPPNEVAHRDTYVSAMDIDDSPVLDQMQNVCMVTLYAHHKLGGVDALHDFMLPFDIEGVRQFAQSLLDKYPQLTAHGLNDRTLY